MKTQNLSIEQVKEIYFNEFDEKAWIINHDEFKFNSACKSLKEIEKCYLNNLLETAMRWFNGSLRDFQELGIDFTERKQKWEKLINTIKIETVCD